MKKNVVILSLLTVFLSACAHEPSYILSGEVKRLNAPQKDFSINYQYHLDEDYVNSLKSFAIDFQQQLEVENNIYSPISIATCLSMLSDGAKEETKREIANVLHYDSSFNHLEEIKNMLINDCYEIIDNYDQQVGSVVDINQSIFIDNSFEEEIKQTYIDLLTDYYFAEVYTGALNSDSMHDALADWINNKTRDFLNVKGEDFKEYAGVLWLVNTIYTKARWYHEFDESFDIKDNFTDLNGNKKEINFMRKNGMSTAYMNDKYTISSLSLQGRLAFKMLLPHEGLDYQDVLSDRNTLNDLLNITPNDYYEINYRIPNFHFQKDYDLNDILKKMGCNLAFDPMNANFKDIAESDDYNLFLAKSKHAAGIDVNHDGIEAAAYTLMVMEATSAAPGEKEIDFYLNRPFMYALTNGDGIPLFIGTITNL